jgi:formylglycine-generating enzyme required for sulfatase activity
LILPLFFILLSPLSSFAQDDFFSEDSSEILDELEKLLEGDFDFEDDESLDDGDDLLDEIDVIMEEKAMKVQDEDADSEEEEEEFLDLDRYLTIIQVTGGCYSMGDNFGNGHYDERPTHRVCVDDFGIADTEVTQEFWEKVTGMNPSQNKGPDNPVDFVSWHDAMNFVVALNERTGRHFRIPTEAEWEYAARGRGKLEEWAGTNDEDDLIEYAWFDFTSKYKSHPVKKKAPNLLGIYDMSGNVWEWVTDYYDMGYYSNSPTANPEGPEFSVWRSIRGGSFTDDSRKLRTSGRYGSVPTRRTSNVGFRIAE